MMAPTRHQETGPAVASPHAALSHSRGCDRDGGEQRTREGEALKETAAAGTGGCHELGPGEGRGGSPLRGKDGPGFLDQLGWGGGCSEPLDGPDRVSHQHFANATQHLFLNGCWGPSLGGPLQEGIEDALGEGAGESGASCCLQRIILRNG